MQRILSEAAETTLKEQTTRHAAKQLASWHSNKEIASIMKWVLKGSDQPRKVMHGLTAKYLRSQGITFDEAKWWRGLYRLHLRNTGNTSAPGRYDLMQRAVELLGGK